MITVVILTHNSYNHLKVLLPTLKWADRILVIDDESTDKTILLAKKYGATVHSKSLNDDFSSQRNFALTKVRTKWVLFLDPDERVPLQTAKEILEIVKKNERVAYAVKRNDIFCGKKLKFGETAHIYLVRLGQKDAGKWVRRVHEYWKVKKPGRLKHHIEHESHNTFTGFIETIKRYAQIEGDYRYRRRLDWSIYELLVFPVGKFIKNYIWYLGILDGTKGFQMALGMSYHSYLVRKNLIRNYFPERNLPSSINILVDIVWMVLGLMVLAQLGRFEGVVPVPVYGFELLMGGAIVWWLGLLLLKGLRPYLSQILLPLGLFLLVLAVSLAVNVPLLSREVISPSLYWFRIVLYVAFFAVMWDMVARKWWRVPLKRILVYVGVLWAIIGMLQYIFIPDTRWLFWYGWDDHYFRMIGSVFDPGYLGLLFVLTLILMEDNFKKSKVGGYLFVWLSMIFTFARSAYLTYIMIVTYLSARRKSLSMIVSRLGITLIAILTIVSVSKPGMESTNLMRTYSFHTRARSVITAYDMFKENPVLGIGFNRYKHVANAENKFDDVRYHPSSPDSSYALILATSGIVGLAALVVLFGYLYQMYKTDEVLIASLLAVGVHSFTNNSLFYPLVMLWLAFLVASKARE